MKTIKYNKILFILMIIEILISKIGMLIWSFIILFFINILLFSIYDHIFTHGHFIVILIVHYLSWVTIIKYLYNYITTERSYINWYINKLKSRKQLYKKKHNKCFLI
jgi:ABC-type polysaccharide transport system permease subunit